MGAQLQSGFPECRGRPKRDKEESEEYKSTMLPPILLLTCNFTG